MEVVLRCVPKRPAPRRTQLRATIVRCFARLLTPAAILLLLIALRRGIAETPAETPIDANAIVDSVGINVHLHYTDTPYNNFALVQGLLTGLGVRHIRDGVVDTTWDEYYKRHNALGREGIRCIFVTSPNQSDTLLATYPSKMAATFEGYEAPNEYNQSNDPHWDDTLKSFLPRLHRITKNNPALDGKSIVIGPSLTQPDAYPKLAGVQQFFDFANMHNYFAGRNPGTPGWGGGGYGSIEWNLRLVHGAWDDKPVMTTETGFTTDLDNKQGIPEAVEAKYMPRLILEQLLHHIQRTYIYELIDVGPKVSKSDAAFGLVRNDGTKKPAYTALQSLIGIAKGAGRPDLDGFPYTLSGNIADVHHLLARRADGTYLLFFWIEKPSFDPDSKKEIAVPPQNVTFSSTSNIRTLQLITFQPDGSYVINPLKPGASLVIKASDSVSVLKVQTGKR
jgi:hypothetical protein